MFSPLTSRWRLVAAVLALSLVAAACGGGESATPPTLATTTSAPAEAEPFSTRSAPEEPEAAGSAPSDSSTSTPEPDASPAVNLFPDIDVLNIADGSTVNLAAELGGGDKATLLWFFAPH